MPPPRIPQTLCLRTRSLPQQISSFSPSLSTLRNFSATSSNCAKLLKKKKSRRHHDPYAIAQARARKAANLSRQAVLQEERAKAMGDPIRGLTTTPFVSSFDTGVAPASTSATEQAAETTASASTAEPESSSRLNYFLSRPELAKSLEYSKALNRPVQQGDEESDIEKYAREVKKHERDHEHVVQAIERIAALENGSSKDRMRINVQRCIETFGRHRTDQTLPPKPAARAQPGKREVIKPPKVEEGAVSAALAGLPDPFQAERDFAIREEKKYSGPVSLLNTKESTIIDVPESGQKLRGGPDTGSSEVQIAILTAKIRTLADFLQTRGKTDKNGKRDLRLLVHKRQKLLKYLRKKDRGGPRFQNVVETLGLGDATWKGEISL